MAAAKYPAEHSTFSDVPEHEKPDGQVPQVVRVISSPPEVNDPTAHVEQLSALFSLNMLSAPQSMHPTLSLRYVPARQNSHCVAPALDVVPIGQAVQLDAPASAEYVPAAQATTLVPSHE